MTRRGLVVAFVELFARHGVTVSEADGRGPMGTHEKDRIWSMLSDQNRQYHPDLWVCPAGRRDMGRLRTAARQRSWTIARGAGATRRRIARRSRSSSRLANRNACARPRGHAAVKLCPLLGAGPIFPLDFRPHSY